MSTLLAYPYGNAGECLRLEILDVPATFEHHKDRLVYVGDDPVAVQVPIRVTGDDNAINLWRPMRDDNPCRLQLVLRLQSVSSRFRHVIEAPIDIFEHDFDVLIDPSKISGDMSIQALVVLVDASPDAIGAAQDRGSTIAWGPELDVQIDDRPPPMGKSLPIEWRHFSEDAALFDDHLFALQTGMPPKILLNSDILGAYEILMSKGTHGSKARIRDATFNLITHQVWTSLLGAAISSLTAAAADNAGATRELLEDVGGWKADALWDWASHLYPEKTSTLEALDQLRDDCLSEEPKLILERLPTAIQERFGTARSFKGFVSQQHLFEEVGE